MKSTLLALLALGGLAAASPVPQESCVPGVTAPSCPTRTIENVIANFDDLQDGSTVPSPYQYLTFTNLTVQTNRKSKGLIPNSKSNYATSGPYPESLTPAPVWSIDGTATTSFDMVDLYAGCISPNNGTTKYSYSPTKCQFTVVCLTTVGRGRNGPILVTYTPDVRPNGGAEMMRVGLGWNYCRIAWLSLYTSDAGTEKTLLVVDSLKYTIREGETVFG